MKHRVPLLSASKVDMDHFLQRKQRKDEGSPGAESSSCADAEMAGCGAEEGEREYEFDESLVEKTDAANAQRPRRSSRARRSRGVVSYSESSSATAAREAAAVAELEAGARAKRGSLRRKNRVVIEDSSEDEYEEGALVKMYRKKWGGKRAREKRSAPSPARHARQRLARPKRDMMKRGGMAESEEGEEEDVHGSTSSSDSDFEANSRSRKKRRKKAQGSKRNMPKLKKKTSEPARRSTREQRSGGPSYAEVPSDDSDWYLTEEEAEDGGEELDDETGSAEGSSPEIYEPERILAIASHTPAQWRERMLLMDTQEVTRGSRWIQDGEEEKMAGEDALIERYLVKWRVRGDNGSWISLSYLHVSWETGEDLVTMCGKTKADERRVDRLLREVRRKEENGTQERMRETYGERCFPEAFTQVDRVLAIENDDESGTPSSYLIKWRDLEYDSATYELPADVESIATEQIKIFTKRNTASSLLASKNGIARTVRSLAKRRIRPDKKPSPLLESPTFRGGHTLREYQLEALNWLVFNWANCRNSMLADEMGLGKTCQTVAFAHQLKTVYGAAAPVLIVAPLATLPHWQREFEGWTTLNTLVFHGNRESIENIIKYEFWYNRDLANGTKPYSRDVPKFDVLVTSYEGAMHNVATLGRLPWSLLVVDEGHRIKTLSSKLSECLHHDIDADARLLLTGTPIQNNVEELWTLLNFLDSEEHVTMAI